MNAANDKACILARVNQTAHPCVWGAAQLANEAITKEEVASGEESEARGYQTGAAASDGDEDGGARAGKQKHGMVGFCTEEKGRFCVVRG